MANGDPIQSYTSSPLKVSLLAGPGALIAGLFVYDFVRFPDKLQFTVVHAIFCAIAFASFLAAYATAKSKVTLFADRVEWTGAFSRARRVLAQDILGFRRTGWGPVRIVPKGGRGQIVVPAEAFEEDVPWLENIDDLDASDREAMRSAARANPRFGATEAERADFIKRLPRRLRWLNLAGWVSSGWAIFWPYPRELLLAFLLAAPVVTFAIMIWARPLVNVDEMRDEPGEISLFGFFAMPSAMLALRGLLDYEFVNDDQMLLIGLACGIPLVALALWCDPPARHRPAAIAGIALACGFLAIGLLIHANTLPDTAPPQRFATTVVKSPGTGRYKNEVFVAPWGEEQGESKVKLAPDGDKTPKPGDRVCIDVHPGALGLRWYTVARCE